MNTAMLLLVAFPMLGGPAAGGPNETQVHWQRSLADALAIAEAEGRPLLLAVNMDGESACERIVGEAYKDPAFVAATRGFVCIVSSVFRHSPRDHDDDGRRIECPRLGEVTCGEHMALEPLVYERLGGDRIAPRHALVLPDGEIVFDLTLLFDIDDVGRRLEREAERAPATDARSTTYLRRAHRERLALEERGFAQTRYEQDSWVQRPQAVRPPTLSVGERGGLLGAPEERALTGDTLRALLPTHPGRSSDDWVDVARQPEFVDDVAAFLREQLLALGDRVERPHHLARLVSLVLLGRVDASPASSTLLLSYDALPGGVQERQFGQRGLEALARTRTDQAPPDASQPDDPQSGESEVAFQLDKAEAAYELPTETELSREVPSLPGYVEPELADQVTLANELARLEDELANAPDDLALALGMGRAALGLARRRMESSGGSQIPLLLEDAERQLKRASEEHPKDVALLLDRARTAYYLGKFEEQQGLALAAWTKETAWSTIPGTVDGAAELSPLAVETLRWLGDASGRLLAGAGGAGERDLWNISIGGRAHLTVALSPYADGGDWVTLASYFAALGRWPEEAWFAYRGLLRFPDDSALHQALSRSLHAAGRPDLAASTAERVAWECPSSATAHWFAGLQHFLHADWLRRGEQPDRALAAYARAAASFATSKELAPEYAPSADHYIAFAVLGRGFAHLLADRQEEAARALVEGLTVLPSIATLRDGLDREALDLLDGSLEFRSGRSSPVEPLAFLAGMEAADPDNAFWARGVSDSTLREALRAEGRGDRAAFEAYLVPSIEAGRRAAAQVDTPENRRTLAQAATVLGTYRLSESDVAAARVLLTEAAPLMGLEAPAETAGADELEALGAELRELIGERRPVDRPGR